MKTLKKVRPYHSVQARRHRGVYHDRADCPLGRQIHSDELVRGTGRLPLCDLCRLIDEEAPAS